MMKSQEAYFVSKPDSGDNEGVSVNVKARSFIHKTPSCKKGKSELAHLQYLLGK